MAVNESPKSPWDARSCIDILTGQFPVDRKFHPVTFLEQFIMFLLETLYHFSLCLWLKYLCEQIGTRDNKTQRDSRPVGRSFTDLYVVVATALLGFLLFACTKGDQTSGWVWGLAIYLVAEMLVTTFRVQLVHIYDRIEAPRSPNRSIMLLLIGYLEVVLAFGILFLANGQIMITSSQSTERALRTHSHSSHPNCSTPSPLRSPSDAFYFSTVTITTLGDATYTPATTGAKQLVVAEVAVGLLMVVFLLANFMTLPKGAWQSTKVIQPLEEERLKALLDALHASNKTKTEFLVSGDLEKAYNAFLAKTEAKMDIHDFWRLVAEVYEFEQEA